MSWFYEPEFFPCADRKFFLKQSVSCHRKRMIYTSHVFDGRGIRKNISMFAINAAGTAAANRTKNTASRGCRLNIRPINSQQRHKCLPVRPKLKKAPYHRHRWQHRLHWKMPWIYWILLKRSSGKFEIFAPERLEQLPSTTTTAASATTGRPTASRARR